MRNRYFFILFCFCTFYLFGQEAGEAKPYTVTFEPLELIDIDENYSQLSQSIPGSLFNEFRDYPNHIYTEKEKNLLKSKISDNYILSIKTKISELIETRDASVFNENYSRNDYEKVTLEIESEREKLNKEVPESITNIGSSAPLYLFLNSSYSESDQKLDSDLVVSGVIEKIEDWIYVKIWVDNKITGVNEIIYHSISSIERIEEMIPGIVKSLKSYILGRQWSSLSFDIDPGDADIILKNKDDKIVVKDFNLLVPGFYNINISKSGYKSENFNVNLLNEQEKRVELKLYQNSTPSVSVQSFPGGADVYSGAVLIGKTPLIIRNPVFPTFLTLKLEGYNDYKYILNDNNTRNIDLFLHPFIIDKNVLMDRKRDIFYKSFTYFLLSIPVSMISYGLSSDYGYTYNREVNVSPGSAESERLMQLSTSWYNVYLGGIFINITLFINTIFDLVDYIKSNEKL